MPTSNHRLESVPQIILDFNSGPVGSTKLCSGPSEMCDRALGPHPTVWSQDQLSDEPLPGGQGLNQAPLSRKKCICLLFTLPRRGLGKCCPHICHVLQTFSVCVCLCLSLGVLSCAAPRPGHTPTDLQSPSTHSYRDEQAAPKGQELRTKPLSFAGGASK